MNNETNNNETNNKMNNEINNEINNDEINNDEINNDEISNNEMNKIHNTLYTNFPNLRPILSAVGVLDFSKLMKTPYSALIGIIVGQKITYKRAKELRKHIYENMEIAQKELGHKVDGACFTLIHINHMKDNLCKLENWSIIERVNTFLLTKSADYLSKDNPQIKENILSLDCIKGIGPWTIQSTILCSLLDDFDSSLDLCDIFPANDKFLQNAIIRLHNITPGNSKINKISLSDVKKISEAWSPYRGIITWYFWRWF